MALKGMVETVEGLPADVAKEYTKVEKDGKSYFVLAIDGDLPDEIVGPLKRAKQHEVNARQDVEKKLKDSGSRIEQLQNEIDEMRRGNIPKGDVDKLENSWKEKLSKLQTDKDAQIAARDTTLQEILVDNKAIAIANAISNAPHLMIPHVKARLKAEMQDGKFVTRVLDKEGKPSALGIEELQKELVADKQFAPIIIQSKASGGGASGSNGGSGAPPTEQKFDEKFDPNKATPAQLVAWSKSRRANQQ